MGRRGGPSTASSSVTRRSTVIVSSVAAIAVLLVRAPHDASGNGSGITGVAAAGAIGVAVVIGLSGFVLAVRRRSLLWMPLVALVPPFGSLACALLPVPPSARDGR